MQRVAILLGALALASGLAHAQTTLFSTLPCEFCTASAVSADGTTVIGVQGINGLRWRVGDASPGVIVSGSTLNLFPPVLASVSADGSVVVGEFVSGQFPEGPITVLAFRWSAAGGLAFLPHLFSGPTRAHGVSGDGSIVVGESFGVTGTEAFRWTQSAMVGLGTLDPAFFFSRATAVSTDGQVIVGESRRSAGPEAFRWTQATGMVGIGDLAGGDLNSRATAVSASGSVIVGQGHSAAGFEAFRWTQATGMVGLGDLPGAQFFSEARAVSGDGSIVVGFGSSNNGTEAFIWTASSGMQRLADVLIAAGVDLTGWHLMNATGISGDGNVIVGNATVPTPVGIFLQGWIARSGSAVFPPGITTPQSLAQSVAETGTFSASGVVAVRTDMRRVVDAGRRLGSIAALEPVRVAQSEGTPQFDLGSSSRAEAYALVSGQDWKDDPYSEGRAPALSVGIAYTFTPKLRLGVGLSAERAKADTIFGGQFRTTGLGAHAFASWNAANPGLRGLIAANYLRLDADIDRGYVNGAGTATSSGSTEGFVQSALARLEYAFPLGERLDVAPYVDYSHTRTVLDAYTESGGPFPAAFDEQKYSADFASIGAEVGYRMSRSTRIHAWLAHLERVRGDTVSISGQFLGLGSFSLSGLRVPDAASTDIGAGFSHQMTQKLRLMGSLGVLSGGSRTLYANIGVGIGL